MRINENMRRLVRETSLSTDNLIAPLFVRHGSGVTRPIGSMPGHSQLSVDMAVREAETLAEMGVPAVLLFGIPNHKDAVGSENFDPQGIVPQAAYAIKKAVPELIVISDMCCCEYTEHGHCGILNFPGVEGYNERIPEGYLLNDPTLGILGKASVVHAQAGADIIAPSGMIDG
ncbi:MAG: porphobilinogen synthase, partial [Oscillochloris sp.]|nr:porphobilinogen synthase [Oscillochloris sp.]